MLNRHFVFDIDRREPLSAGRSHVDERRTDGAPGNLRTSPDPRRAIPRRSTLFRKADDGGQVFADA
jgi:hypothetical protein